MSATAPPDRFRTVTDVIEGKAGSEGDRPILQYGDTTVTLAELDRRANAVGNALAQRGVEPGDTVCLFLYNSLEYLYAYLGVAKLGATVAPIDTRFSGDTLAFVLSETGATTIFLDGQTREAYEAVRDDVASIREEYFLGATPGDRSYRAIETLLDGDAAEPPDVAVDETDTLSVTYVQRSATEQPKGVMLPHFSYINTGWEVAANLFEFAPSDRVFTTLPLYSIFTVQLGFMGSLLADARFVLGDPFDPDAYWRLVDRYDATVMLYLGRMLSVLQNQDRDPPGGTTPVELAIGHGFGFWTDETLIRNFEERFDITVLEGYGCTQAATVATYNTPTDRKVGSSGRPVSYAEVQIVDEKDRPVATGETGEIVIRPTRPNTMLQRYYDDPAATVDLCRNQWIHSGDIGYLDADGYLHFVANRDNSIYRGRIAGRVSSLEIESVIESRTGVRESAVVGVETDGGNESIKAVVVPTEEATLTPVDVCRHCEQQLPYLKVPRYIDLRDELPRTPSGKIDKGDLRSLDRDDTWDRERGYDLRR